MTCVSSNGIKPPGSNVTMLTCMSWRKSLGSTKRVVAQRPSVPGMATGSMSRLVGDEGGRRGKSGDCLVALPDPVEAGGLGARIAQGPGGGWRNIGVAARLHLVARAGNRQLDVAFDDEDYALGTGVWLRAGAAAAGGDLHDVLRERFGKAGHRARQHP